MRRLRFAAHLGAAALLACVAADGVRAAGPAAPDAAATRAEIEATWLVQDEMRRRAARAEKPQPQAQPRQAGGITTRSDAAGGVDGVRNGAFGFHTPLEDKPWWHVDLGQGQPLDRAVIYNRCNSDPDRAFRLIVLLSEDGKAWRQVYQHDGTPFLGASDGKPLVVPLDGAQGRFVRVQLPARGYLHLDEVEVYARSDPKVNVALGRAADQSRVSPWSSGQATAAPLLTPPRPAEPAEPEAYPVREALARAQWLLERRRSEGVPVDPLAGALAELAAKVESAQAAGQAGRELYLQARHVVRALVLADPLLAFDKLLFVKRYTYCSSHIYTDHFDGSKAFGGNLCVLSPIAPDGQVTELVPQLTGGIFGRFDLSFDGRRVVFAYKKPGAGYRIYEVGIDGAGLRQVTADAPDEEEMQQRFNHGYDDLDPCYLPDGRIMFASTRSRRTVLCDPRFTTTSLHVVDADGGNLRCLSSNTVNEFTPAMLPDGRVIYTRWEYIDKGCGDVQSLWAMRPDGSHSAHVFKNNVARPATLIDARGIPGSSRLIAVGAPHMPLAVGPVVRIDIGITQRMPEAMTNLTPEIEYPGHNGYPTRDQGYYKEPFPLSEELFLVAYNPQADFKAPAGYGLYVMDAAGHRELVYRDAAISCFQPVPLRPRPLPPEVTPAAEPADAEAAQARDGRQATLFMQDVYQGMDGIERGRVKYLRIVEDVPKPWSVAWESPKLGNCLGLQHPAVSLKGHFAIKKVHGVVEVSQDGSAHFTVPADRNLYFQALDEDFMELQRMRTFVNLMPGERRSCIGCHEPRSQAPVVRQTTASREPAREPAAQPGDAGPRFVHYPRDVQPILDRHCVRCHDGSKPKPALNLTGQLTTLFCRSYEELVLKKLINNIDVDPRAAYIPAEPPLTFGSHRSRIVEVLRGGHNDVRLTREEFVRLVTWIDTNANYYGTYEGKNNIKWKDDPEFRPDPRE